MGYGASDKAWGAKAKDYEEDPMEMAVEYSVRNEAGESFVHIRKKRSSKTDLRALSRLTNGGKFHTANLRGVEAGSILTTQPTSQA